jgi:hypothetical protein
VTRDHVPGCTGKRKFATRELAEHVNATMLGKGHREKLYPYQCPHCGCWHTSKQSPEEHARRMAQMEKNRKAFLGC